MKEHLLSGKRILIYLIICLLIMALAALFWISADYEPMPAAFAALLSDDEVIIQDQEKFVTFIPVQDTLIMDESVGVIFYPGGKVDPIAYAPLMKSIARKGVPCFIVKMPLQIAVLGVKRGHLVIDDYPEIRQWVIAGHSLGGVMACTFALDNLDTIAGIALLAAYPTDKVDLSRSGLTVTSIVGSLDTVISEGRILETRGLLPADARVIRLEGGNHAQFGDYGDQKGDTPATMPRTIQQDMTTEAVLDIITDISRR